MAAAVAQAMVSEAGLQDRISVESFGTAGYHQGESADSRAIAALRRNGWPAEGHRARKITAEDVATIDMILCADNSNLRDVRRLAPEHEAKVRLLRSFDPASIAGDGEVPDPWGGNAKDFDQALELIEAACRGLIGQLATTSR